MSDKHLSGEEKRAKMKEQFKKELAQRKEFSEKVKNLRRLQNINNALDGMKMEDDSQDWIDRLDQETAFNEAKTEMALEGAAVAAQEAKDEAEIEAAVQMSEAEMQKLAAEEMVRKMKEEMAREAAVHITGGGEEASSGGNLLNVELSPKGETVEKEEEERNSDRPARKMMIGMEVEEPAIESAVESTLDNTAGENSDEDSSDATES